MILLHRDWDNQTELEKSMTVREFISEILLKDGNKDTKYYRISTKHALDGDKQNMIIYYENSIVKSHHSTGKEFDYNRVIDWEILPFYYERTIRPEDIRSMDLDFININDY